MNTMKSVEIMMITDWIRSLDNEGLKMLAERLVQDNASRADTLAWFIDGATRNMMVEFGFSAKVNAS